MRIAFLANPEAPGGWYRGLGPMVALHQRGHEIRQVVRPGEFRANLIHGCDVVHVYRECDDETLRLVKRAKEAGTAVVWDNDDNLAAVPKSNSGYKEYGGAAGARVQKTISRLLDLADLVTAPSAMLCEHYRERGAPHVQLIENYVRDEIPSTPARRNGAGVRVGWLAGSEHHLDVERIPIKDQLERLLATHADVRVTTIGVGLGMRDERYRHVRRLDFVKLPEEMASFDVGIAPIADIPFNQGRSNVKLKEYAAQGIPWLASPIGPYGAMGEQQGGRLVADDGWYDALDRLVRKERERRKLAKRAAKWGTSQTIGANAQLWEDALAAAVERAQSAR
jgi:glycosyltransferase involved in cell wall biosynthesis